MDSERRAPGHVGLAPDALALHNPLAATSRAYAEYSHRGLTTFCALLLNTAVVMLATYGAWSLAGVVIDHLSR
jgi:hypothetical protein